MQFVNIAKVQLKENKVVPEKYGEFFEEYFSVFGMRDIFFKNTKNEMLQFTKRGVESVSETLKVAISVNIHKLTSLLPGLIMPDIIFFIGPGYVDGHGILLDRRPYAFFDLTSIRARVRNKDFCLKAQLFHEIAHAIHYYYSHEFYPKKSPRSDIYLKRMIGEGIATYISFKALDITPEKYYWFGLLDKTETAEWIKKCKSLKKHTAKLFYSVILKNEKDEKLFYSLFSVSGSGKDDWINGRCGYYYGFNIVSYAGQVFVPNRLVNLKFSEYKSFVNSYFEFEFS